jgi:hypothetical protein
MKEKRTLLVSSKKDYELTQDELLNELADIFVESIFLEIEHGKQYKTGSDLLPGIYQRTG